MYLYSSIIRSDKFNEDPDPMHCCGRLADKLTKWKTLWLSIDRVVGMTEWLIGLHVILERIDMVPSVSHYPMSKVKLLIWLMLKR
jgi:hypothetical protein